MYKSGDIIKGKITNITHFGFFFSTDENWNGLIHISEVSDNYIYDINEHFSKGQELDILVLDIDEKKKQIKGSYKQINKTQLKTKTFDSKKDFNKLKKTLDHSIDKTMQKIKEEQ